MNLPVIPPPDAQRRSEAYTKRMLHECSAQLLHEMSERHKITVGDRERPDLRKSHPYVLACSWLLIGAVGWFYFDEPQRLLIDLQTWPELISAVSSFLALLIGASLSGYILNRSLPHRLTLSSVWRTLIKCTAAGLALLGALLLILGSFRKFDDAAATSLSAVATGGVFSVILCAFWDFLIERVLKDRAKAHSVVDKSSVKSLYVGIYKPPKWAWIRGKWTWLKRGISRLDLGRLPVLRALMDRVRRRHASDAN